MKKYNQEKAQMKKQMEQSGYKKLDKKYTEQIAKGKEDVTDAVRQGYQILKKRNRVEAQIHGKRDEELKDGIKKMQKK